MNKDDAKSRISALAKKAGVCKYVLLVIAVGLLLLLWPENTVEPEAAEVSAEGSFSLSREEARLEEILSRISGAGEVAVMLAVKNGMEYVYVQDSEWSDGGERVETVILSAGSGTEEMAVQTLIYPTYQGAVVVCDGGDDPAVKLEIIQAVSSLTGLSSAKVTVCKGVN